MRAPILVAALTLAACGPGTPGVERVCGPAPDPSLCPAVQCVCTSPPACGWSCADYDVLGDGGDE